MQFAHSMERAVTYAVTAFERMKALKVAPTPNNYEMWYAYVADSLPELRQEIDHMLSRGTAFTPEVCESLYHRHLGHMVTRDGFDDASRRLHDTMTSVASAVGTGASGRTGIRTVLGVLFRHHARQQWRHRCRSAHNYSG